MKIRFTVLLGIIYCSFTYGQQPDTLYGHMFDYDGETLIGGIIFIQDIRPAALTDIYGEYQIALPDSITSPLITFGYEAYAYLKTDIQSVQKVDVIMMEYMGFPSVPSYSTLNIKKWWRKYKREYGMDFFLKGQLLDRNNYPLANVQIKIEGGQDRIVQTDSEGRFQLKTSLAPKGAIIKHFQSSENSNPLVIATIFYFDY